MALEGVPARRPRRRLTMPSPEGGYRMSNDRLEQKPSRRLWVLAAPGRAGAASRRRGAGDRASADRRRRRGLGASGVEIGFEMASPKVTDDRLPPGPDTDASMASPQLAEQKAEVKETELPKDKPTETRGSRPDRDAEQVEEAERGRSEDRGGADPGLHRVGRREATATPSSTPPEGRTPVAPAQGKGETSCVSARLGEGAVAPFRAAQALPGRAHAVKRESSGDFTLRPQRVTCCRPAF